MEYILVGAGIVLVSYVIARYLNYKWRNKMRTKDILELMLIEQNETNRLLRNLQSELNGMIKFWEVLKEERKP